jgi:ribosomal-protein-alanine N-acetyltransferase
MRAINFPDSIPALETKDLDLRPITMEMAQDYFKICSDPLVMRMWGTPCHEDIMMTQDLIEQLDKGFNTHQLIRWGIFEKEKNVLIGDVGYWRFLKFRLSAESGAKLHPDYWGKNYMPQALGRIIEFGFTQMGLNSIEGNIDPENKASLRLVEKLGYKYIGEIENYSYCSWRDCFIDSKHFILGKSHWTNPKL